LARKAKPKRDSVEQYTHKGKKRPNNPPVGLVDSGTDPDQPSKRYQYDPRLDPQLQWSGKQENAEFEVDTVSLHVHERIDPHTILEKAMKPKQAEQQTMFHYFETPENNPPLRDAIEFYKHDQNWSNRLIAGDSLLVMNSLLEKEGMEDKVQMIYVDPPYGIKYGSNFQPFVHKRDVKDGKDEDLTQEPETIKAFRDTWELEIHSYLTYLRNRLYLAKQLLNDSGSCAVQISDDNLHYVRNIMDEVFGVKNFVSVIAVRKTSFATSKHIPILYDYIVWYAKDITKLKYRKLFLQKPTPINDPNYKYLELKNGKRRLMTKEERQNPTLIPANSRMYRHSDITSQGKSSGDDSFVFEEETFNPGTNHHWKASLQGMHVLAKRRRIVKNGNSLSFVKFFDDFGFEEIANVWNDTGTGGFGDPKIYVVQTTRKTIQRFMLMTTDPGDLVIDPTCGSGTTAAVAEQWGRRWITCDSSRISVAIARQRLMTLLFDYYGLKNENDGVKSGFKYNVAAHQTLGSIAKNEQPPEEILYDSPITDKAKTRITGPFTVEAVPSPTVKSIDSMFEQNAVSDISAVQTSQEQWRNELYKTGIRGRHGQKIEFTRVETHPATKWLHADAETKEEKPKRAMVSFGPEHAPLEQRQVELALEEARALVPKPKMVIFAAMQFDPEAAKDIDELSWPGVTVLKVEMNKDLLTDDLKKKRSSNESFWLMGQPDVELQKTKDGRYAVTVNGFDYYNARTGEVESGESSRISMWMLDADYDGRSLYPSQVFFPMEGKTGGWSRLAKTLRAQLDEDLISKYQGTESILFEGGSNRRIAVKIIDDRGIESMKIIDLE